MSEIPAVVIVERLTRLETEMEQHKTQTREINRKLDELLSLRSKGVGAFWLASALTGTGILGLVAGMIDFFRVH